ncbi:MAG: hypothetical protein ACLR0U_17925 [Enterocloster clostridioformis]
MREAFRLIDGWFEEMAGFQSYTTRFRPYAGACVETWVFISGYSIPEGGCA